MKRYKVYSIRYDTDGEKVSGLPSSIVFEVDEEEDPDFDPANDLADMISDKTGWCVFGFSWKELPGHRHHKECAA